MLRLILEHRAFTLIELLIVVAIIAILTAIAVPNLLEAQTRTRITRVHNDHRTLTLGLEAYRVDQNAYPSAESNGTMKWAVWVTTPVAYLQTVHLEDPFTGYEADPHDLQTLRAYPYYRYYGFNERGYVNADTETGTLLVDHYTDPGSPRLRYYLLFSHGPDQVRSKADNGATFMSHTVLFEPERFSQILYDPTNGAVSNGEIFRHGGELVGRATASMRLIERTRP